MIRSATMNMTSTRGKSSPGIPLSVDVDTLNVFMSSSSTNVRKLGLVLLEFGCFSICWCA